MESNIVRCPDPKVADAMIARINDVRKVVAVYHFICDSVCKDRCSMHVNCILPSNRSLLLHDGRMVIPLEVLWSAL